MNNSRVPVYLVVVVVALAIGGLVYYRWTRTPDPGPGLPAKKLQIEGLVYLDNGLTAADRADFYHLAEGSEIYPVLWLQALKTKTGKYFLDDVERLGFLPDPDHPKGLPVGLTSGVTRGLEALGPMTGLNCAACHVGELQYDGKHVRIDGAPNFLNTREFFVTVIESAIDTAKSPAKLIAFAAKVHEVEEAESKSPAPQPIVLVRKLLVKMAEKGDDVFQARLQKIIDEEFASKPFDFKAALKEQITDAAKFKAKIVQDLKLDKLADLAKKSTLLHKIIEAEADHLPVLTDVMHDLYVKLRLLRGRAEFLKKLGMVGENPATDWGPGRVDAFGSARAFLFQPGYSPVTPVSYPPLFELESHDWFHYDNNTTTFLERNFGQALGVGAVWDENSKLYSLQPKNLYKLENLAHKIAAPKWQESIFGKIDPKRAEHGKQLYQQYCAECHDADKNKKFDKLEDMKQLLTDPARATMFAEPVPPSNQPFPDMIKDTLAKIKEVALKEFDEKDRKLIEAQPRKWLGPAKYSARSIKGAWATGPYLHNGSVPTLDDLLKPAKDRPSKFYVGSHQYDPIKLGYVSDEKMVLFDVATPGNSNAGHEGKRYGTEMSADDRKDLLEYLKTQ